MRITMLRTRNWVVPGFPAQTIRYREGKTYTVKQEWGEALIAEGSAKRGPAAKRGRVENLTDWDGDGEAGGPVPVVEPVEAANGVREADDA